MRDEGLYFEDIVEAADHIAGFLSGVTKEQFEDSELIRSGVLQKLTVIGEAAAHISTETRCRHPEVEWTAIVGFRNIAVHAYFAVDWDRVWDAATLDAPVLREQAARILADEFPQEDTDN